MARYSSVLELVGETPVIDVSQLSPKPNVKIFAKLEGRNPAGSVKDRVAKSLVEAAPKAIKEGVNKAEAEDIKAKIEAAGGTVEIK